MTIPSLSIISPVKNGETYFQQAIDSLKAQTGPFDLEYVVIDGQSDDRTMEIAESNTDIITKCYSEPDGGMYDALSKGFERTTGEIMGWINADDVYFPWALDTVTKVFSDLPEVEWSSTLNPVAINEYGKIFNVRRIAGFSREAFMDGIYIGYHGFNNPFACDFIQQESTCWRRKLLDRIGPDPLSYYRVERRQAGDFSLWAQFAAEAELYGLVSPLCAWRQHPDQWTDPETYMMEVERSMGLLRKEMDYKGFKPPPSDFMEYTGKYLVSSNTGSWSTLEKPFFVLPQSDLKSTIAQGTTF